MGENYANMTECEKFGICSGCASNCPVYERGECESQKEVEEQIKKGIIE